MIMTRLPFCILAALVVAFIVGCEPRPGGNATSGNAGNANNSNVPERPALPDKAKLVELERNAFDAWKNKDGKFFEDFLTANFTIMTPAGPMDKAAAVKEISEHKCEIGGFSFADEAMTVAGSDAAILTIKVTADGTCEGQKIPSPVWSASVYVRDGEKWKAAYHNEVPVTDANANPATGEKPLPPPPAAKQEDKPADPLTQALLAAENKGWEAWKTRDAKALGEATMLDLIYIDARGSGRYKRDEAIKSWTDPSCSVKSYSLSNAQSRPLSANAALFTYKGTADGACGGKPVLPVWGTTLYMKEGGVWKALMIVQLPA
jgi:ketosteroid isomerase-like protein